MNLSLYVEANLYQSLYPYQVEKLSRVSTALGFYSVYLAHYSLRPHCVIDAVTIRVQGVLSNLVPRVRRKCRRGAQLGIIHIYHSLTP